LLINQTDKGAGAGGSSTGESDDSTSMLSWVIPLAILGTAGLLLGAWALTKKKQSEGAEFGATRNFANPMHGPSSGSTSAGSPTWSNGAASTDGFVRRDSNKSSTVHVAVGANELYDGIPAESTYAEVTSFGHDNSDAATMHGYTDVAPLPDDAGELGVGIDGMDGGEVTV